MEPLSATGRVILGMIRIGRRTGYDIKAAVDRSTRFFWAASYGQIYPELKRLEERGLVESAASPDGGRRRTEYSLTKAGEAALHGWLTSSEELVYELRDEGLLKFFFADALSPEEAVTLLRATRAHHEEVVQRLRAIEPVARAKHDEQGFRFPYLTLLGGIELHEFLGGWCRRMESEITKERTP